MLIFPKDPHPKQNKGLVRGPCHPCELEGSTPNAMEGPRTLRVQLIPVTHPRDPVVPSQKALGPSWHPPQTPSEKVRLDPWGLLFTASTGSSVFHLTSPLSGSVFVLRFGTTGPDVTGRRPITVSPSSQYKASRTTVVFHGFEGPWSFLTLPEVRYLL